jgi:hypothetical protein
LFIFAQQQNLYKLLKNQCFCFGFFHVVVLVLLAKQQQQKIVNLYTISVCYAWDLVRPTQKLEQETLVLDTCLQEKFTRKGQRVLLKFSPCGRIVNPALREHSNATTMKILYKFCENKLKTSKDNPETNTPLSQNYNRFNHILILKNLFI